MEQSKEQVQGTLEVSGVLACDVSVDHSTREHQLSNEELSVVVFVEEVPDDAEEFIKMWARAHISLHATLSNIYLSSTCSTNN